MCCGAKCLFFIPVRTGSLIFGYIIAVISALGTIACTGGAMFFAITLAYPRNQYESGPNINHPCCSYESGSKIYYMMSLILISGYLVEFLSSFICSVLLLVGITQNKPALVKTFLIYGMVQVVLLLVYFIMVHCLTDFFVAGFLFLALGFVGVYVMCLYMVFMAYQQMTDGHVFQNPPVNSVIQLLTSRIRSDRRGEIITPSGI